MKRVVYVLTKNPNKAPEYEKNFGRYGIEVVQGPPTEDPEVVARILRGSTPERKVLAAFRETSDLFIPGTDTVSACRHLSPVENVTVMRAYTLRGDEVVCREYVHRTEGFVDLRRARTNGSAFGWDDIFVLKGVLRSYDDLARQGFKISSRDMVISQFLHDHVYYKELVGLNHTDRAQERPIDFALDPAAFVQADRYMSGAGVVSSGMAALFTAVLNEGVFFRSARNRRQKIYWLPGLNAGIPFTPKKDDFHEATYIVHDFGHFLFPDLILTGNDTPEARRLYITYRMMSEATTLVLADMLFVDALEREGMEYDFAKRKIHPLLVATGIDLSDPSTRVENLRVLIAANVRYCLHGDDGPYRALIERNGGDPAALEAFRKKYMPFFVEDFRWTENNYASMAARSDELARWWRLVAPLRAVGGFNLRTVEEFAAGLPAEGDLTDNVFDRVFRESIAPVLGGGDRPLAPAAVRRNRAFLRYMTGQLAVFARFEFLPEAHTYAQHIIDALPVDVEQEYDLGALESVRAFYEQFIGILLEKNLVSGDDAATYRDIYPLFEPFYINYDLEFAAYEPLASVSARILA